MWANNAASIPAKSNECFVDVMGQNSVLMRSKIKSEYINKSEAPISCNRISKLYKLVLNYVCNLYVLKESYGRNFANFEYG